MWEIVKIVGIYLFLLLCSWQDIREKKLSVKMLFLFGISFFGLSLLFEQMSFGRRIVNVLPGAVAFVLAFLTGEQIGYGDAACLVILGSMVSADLLVGAVLGGLLLLSTWSIVLLVGKRADRRTTMPFMPFLTVGMLWQMAVR